MSRELILGAYVAFLVCVSVLVFYSRRNPERIMPLPILLNRVLHFRATRFGIAVFWWWIGMHYLGG